MNDITRPATPFPQSPQASGSTGIAADRPEASTWSELGPGTRTAESSTDKSADAGQRDGAAMERVVKGAHDTVDRLAESAAPHVERLQQGAEKLKHTGDEWSESLRTTVRANPLAALATALAVGVVFAKLTS